MCRRVFKHTSSPYDVTVTVVKARSGEEAPVATITAATTNPTLLVVLTASSLRPRGREGGVGGLISLHSRPEAAAASVKDAVFCHNTMALEPRCSFIIKSRPILVVTSTKIAPPRCPHSFKVH